MADAIGWFVNRAAALKEAQRIADSKSCKLYVAPGVDVRQRLWEIHETAPLDIPFELIRPRAQESHQSAAAVPGSRFD